jgi:regulator of nucleoside diphosphate kinase
MPQIAALCITSTDRIRLLRLLSMPGVSPEDRDRADELQALLDHAGVLGEGEVPQTLVTMNSQLELRAGNEDRLVTVVYPFQADESAGRISVLSSAGLALLGRSAGDEVEWLGPHGLNRYVVTRIVFQPEASGDPRL